MNNFLEHKFKTLIYKGLLSVFVLRLLLFFWLLHLFFLMNYLPESIFTISYLMNIVIGSQLEYYILVHIDIR